MCHMSIHISIFNNTSRNSSAATDKNYHLNTKCETQLKHRYISHHIDRNRTVTPRTGGGLVVFLAHQPLLEELTDNKKLHLPWDHKLSVNWGGRGVNSVPQPFFLSNWGVDLGTGGLNYPPTPSHAQPKRTLNIGIWKDIHEDTLARKKATYTHTDT